MTTPASKNFSQHIHEWVPTILTICTLVYFLGMRDKGQDIDAEMVKSMNKNVQELVRGNISIVNDISNINTRVNDLKTEISAFGDMKQDVSCLKNAFKTGGDPSKC